MFSLYNKKTPYYNDTSSSTSSPNNPGLPSNLSTLNSLHFANAAMMLTDVPGTWVQ